MSFRSRSHTKPVAPPRRRSSSLTRNGTSTSGTSSYSSRPMSIHGSSLGGSYQPQSSYLYGSNQNLRSDYGSNSFDTRRNSYGTSLGTSLKFPLTTMNTSSSSSSYVSPYKDRYSQNYYGNSSGSSPISSGYVSAYKDRTSSYYNPYTSYDNGITTAGLSFQMSNPSRDYRTNSMSTSTGNLNASKGSGSMNSSQSINEKVANIGRSQSLREQERKSRSRKCKEAVKAAVPDTQTPYESSAMSSTLSSAQKSVSSLSLHSEGYEVNRISDFYVFSFFKLIFVHVFNVSTSIEILFFLFSTVWK